MTTTRISLFVIIDQQNKEHEGENTRAEESEEDKVGAVLFGV